MKTAAIFLFAILSISLCFLGRYSIAPSDVQAALAWNLGLMLAPILALAFQWKMAKERQIPVAIFLCVWAVVNSALVLGSRAGAWTANDWHQIWNGGGLPALPGKTVLGGLLLAIVAFALLRRWWRFSFDMADALVIGLPLAGVTARIGCLVAGCCFGIPTGSENGICYGPGSPAFAHHAESGLLAAGASSSLPVYPIQGVLVIGNLIIFWLLWHFRKRLNRPGALSFLGLTLLTVQRFGIEFLRDIATNRGQFGLEWGGLKTAQWFCLCIAAIGTAGFLWVQLGKARELRKRASASLNQQALVVGSIALGVLLMQSVLTLDESMVILISCAPAIFVLGKLLWRAQQSGQKVLIPAFLLSATTFGLITSPVDTIKSIPFGNRHWMENGNRQWIEIGAGGGFGNYQNITRDCGGNVVNRDYIRYNAAGVDISSNWQRDDLFFKAGLRGATGRAEPQDAVLPQDDYRYSSFGLYGKISYNWLGLSLGGMSRQQIFENGYKESRFLASGSLRIGSVKHYSFDVRFYEEPAFAFSNEPLFSTGLFNWGFKDPSGDTFLRSGFAGTYNGELAFHLAGGFPLGNRGLSGTVSTYLGNFNMVHFGLRYRFDESSRYR